MRPRLARLALPLVLLLALLPLAACNIPAREAPAEPGPDAAEPTAEPVAEPAAEDLIAVVVQDANVRTGPGTDHAIAFWLTAGVEVTVVGRNAEGDWLQIEHEDRPGWIFAALTDLATEPAAQLPTDAPSSEPVVAEPTPEAVEPAPEPEPTVEPTPEPTSEPEAAPPDRVSATVTGTVVNLRQGPGTGHAIAGQARQGDALHATGRNADGSWLQIEDPANPAGHVWIYGPLTDIDGATVQTLVDVSASAVETAPEPTPAPTPEPAPESAPQTPSAAPVPVADCTQLHTVNPNETRLVQITDWFGLDLATVAALNGIAPDAPLTAGSQICLSGTGQVQEPTPQPVQEPPAASPPELLAFPVDPLSMGVGGSAACTIDTNGSVACLRNNYFENRHVETPPGVYSQVTVGGDFACALRNDATAHCWGHHGGIIKPPGQYVELNAGGGHACGLTSSGHINCWGANDHNQATPPAGTFRSLGVGAIHSCAIQTDDTVTCWGLIDASDTPPNKRFESIRGGANYTCGLLRNGELECWGTYTRPVTPPRGQFTSFDTGAYHACAVRSNGEMVCWGFNREGEGSPPPGPWKSVACGFDQTCGVRTDGTMECWGSGW